jgi:hypothetical protein
MLDQLEELHPRSRVIAERAQHGARDGERVLLLDTAHRHAEVRALHDHRDAQRIDLLADGLRNLVRHTLLDLEPPGEDFHQPRNLAETDHSLTRDVGDVAPAEEREQVMLAQTVEVDVLDDHHLAIIDGKQGAVDHGIDVGLVAAGQELQRLLHASRRTNEPLAVRILSQLHEQLPYERFHRRIVHRAFCARRRARSRRPLPRS